MAETDLSGSVLDGRYQVIEPIAEGAMGSVYRGERLKLGRAVAIKVMHHELPDELASRQRFEREAKLMALLEHPNCVSVIDFGLHEDKPFLVMDFIKGTSLLDMLDKLGRLETAKAADIIRQVLSGLAHAHELGIVHRDIKPANIMISEKAGLGHQVRILDFGLARLQEATGTKLTTGIVVGTPNYMAPEQCKGGNIDARTDLYACGVMLFEMLTGRKPFLADDPIQVVRKHLMEQPPMLASVEPNIDFGDFETVVARALAKAPSDRFDSAVDMAKAVDAAANRAAKMSAAALFSRAVPEGAPVGNQQATMSGWGVPPDVPQQAAADQPGAAGQWAPPPGLPQFSTGAPPPGAYPPGASWPPPPPGASWPPPPPTGPPGPGAPPPPGAMPPGAYGVPPGGTMELSNSALMPESAVVPIDDRTTIDPRIDPKHDRTTIDPGSTDTVRDGAPPLSSTDTVRDSAPPGAGLPPLPKAAPYVPPTISTGRPATGPAPTAPRPTTGPAATVRPTTGPAATKRPTTGPAATVPSDESGPAVSSSGAPDRSLGIPPTRPTTAPSAGPSMPRLTKKQLMIGGGGLLLLVVVIAIIASGGSKKSTTTAKPGSGTGTIEMDEVKVDPGPVIERATALIESEDYDEAVSALKRARKSNPDNAQLAFLSGKANFGRLWWTDGIEDFRDAIRIDEGYKENTELLKIVLRGFLTTPDTDDRIVEFMREIGAPMRPLLEDTAANHPKKGLRARARAELNAKPD